MSTQAAKALDPEWFEVGQLEDIPRLGARVVRTPQEDIALFRTAGDEVFALRDRCPHNGGPLSQGLVHDRSVTCPLHNWCIHLDSGKARAPDEGGTVRYDVRVENETVYLSLTPVAS